VAKFRILIKPAAAKEIEAIPSKKVRQRLVERIRQLAENLHPPGCEKLSRQEKYRLRQGSFRILYTIADRELVAIVFKVGHRQDVHR
jgi:mRNA interferase RelE/StbE